MSITRQEGLIIIEKKITTNQDMDKDNQSKSNKLK